MRKGKRVSERTRVVSAPSWLKHFFNQIAPCLQSSRWAGSEEMVGMEMNLERAYVIVSTQKHEIKVRGRGGDLPSFIPQGIL